MQTLSTMMNRNIFFLAILLETNCLNLSSSEMSGIKECNFRAYGSLSFIGGSQNRAPATSKFKCIMGCASNASCQGFAYNGGDCVQADRSRTTSLAFTADPRNIRIRRSVLLPNLKFDPVTLVTDFNVTLVNKLSIGDLLYLNAVLLKQENVQIDIYDKPDKANVTYQMRARCDNAMCHNPYVSINFKLNNIWKVPYYQESIVSRLKENATFEVHVLITANGMMTYLNGVFLHTLNSVLSPLTANFVHVHGNMQLLEFSL